jgi:hypothetical protein
MDGRLRVDTGDIVVLCTQYVRNMVGDTLKRKKNSRCGSYSGRKSLDRGVWLISNVPD